MKKFIKEFPLQIIASLLVVILIWFMATGSGTNDAGTNYTAQQIANFEMSMRPDTSQAVRLMPDDSLFWRTDSVKASGPADTVFFNDLYTKRYKFTIAASGGIIKLRMFRNGSDTIYVRSGASFSSDYLHPKYDSMLTIEPVGTADYDFGSQGR